MKKNMGSADRIIRLIVAAIVAVLYFTHAITGILGIVLIIVAAIFVMTSFISFCPIYWPFGISTNKKKS
jgi:sterol desaturase/sphingolipid hydroxylase (fatty acid hydroxylase superfamily)